MNIRLDAPNLTIAHNELVRLDHGRGARVRCASGVVWITQDGDPTDHVLTAGNAVCFEHDAPIVITALEEALVHLSERARPSPTPLRVAGRALVRSLGHALNVVRSPADMPRGSARAAADCS